MHTWPPPDPDVLMAHVQRVDTDLAAAGADGAIIIVGERPWASGDHTWFPLEGAHPLDVLLGFVAPLHWRALGVSTAGRAQHLDELGRPQPDASGAAVEPDEVTVTMLVDRSGAGAGVMRRGRAVLPLPGRPEGLVADACRRALGLPTSPPPPSSIALWTLAWLDRVVDVAGRADAPSRLATWGSVARLHAAAGAAAAASSPPADPAALAEAAAALARAWPWARLREDPAVVDVPGPPPSLRLAQWMDDGIWARWLLSHLPAADDLLSAVRALLPPVLADQVEQVAREAWR